MAKTYTCEKDVKREVKRLLDKHKWYWWMPPANGFGQTGIADFNALRAGVFLAVETKFGSNKLRPMQRGYLESVTAESGFGFIVTDKNIEWFEAWLTAFDSATRATLKGGQPTEDDGATMLNAIKAMTEMLADGS